MRFLLYNIRYGSGIGGRFHLPVPYAGYLKRSGDNYDRIASFIEEKSPDIVGLVEVDSGSFRTGKNCQARTLARRLGYQYVVESKYKADSVAQRMPVLCHQGNAILSRYPILKQQLHYFNRGVKRLVIEVKTGEVTIFLVHLSLTYRNRQHQLGQLHRLVSAVAGPVIVAGDFNVLWGEEELDLFLAAAHLCNANVSGRASHPSRTPRRQLDYILHSPDLVVDYFAIPRVLFSDHAPLICDCSRKK